MKSQIFLTGVGLVLATTVLGFAAVDHLASFHSRETMPVPVAEPSNAIPPRRIDCYHGMKGEPNNLYRGWVCEPAPAPTLTD
jgi:hypothetical protein